MTKPRSQNNDVEFLKVAKTQNLVWYWTAIRVDQGIDTSSVDMAPLVNAAHDH